MGLALHWLHRAKGVQMSRHRQGQKGKATVRDVLQKKRNRWLSRTGKEGLVHLADNH